MGITAASLAAAFWAAAAAAQPATSMLTCFGTYSGEEEKKTVTVTIVASIYPNAEGTSQTRTIDKLTVNEFGNTPRGAARDGPAAANHNSRAK